MRKQHSSKASVQTIHIADSPAVPAPPVSTEVIPRPKRRFKSNAEKRRIVTEADACTLPGEVGLLLRREGIYSSNLCNWRQQLRAADEAALDAKKRGPKPNPELAEARRLEALTRQNAQLQSQLDKAMLIIEVQKKVSMLIGLTLATPAPGGI